MNEIFFEKNYQFKSKCVSYFISRTNLIEIMGHCEVQQTRKALYFAFNNRATPQNVEVLKNLIEKRNQLATSLGSKTFISSFLLLTI